MVCRIKNFDVFLTEPGRAEQESAPGVGLTFGFTPRGAAVASLHCAKAATPSESLIPVQLATSRRPRLLGSRYECWNRASCWLVYLEQKGIIFAARGTL